MNRATKDTLVLIIRIIEVIIICVLIFIIVVTAPNNSCEGIPNCVVTTVTVHATNITRTVSITK